MHDLKRHLLTIFNDLETIDQFGEPDYFDLLTLSERVEAAKRQAARFGIHSAEESLLTPRAALAAVGRLLTAIPSETLTAQQVAAFLGCTVRTVWRLEARGKIPEARRTGGLVRWNRADLERSL